MVGWVWKLKLMLNLAKVEVEAELGNKRKTVTTIGPMLLNLCYVSYMEMFKEGKTTTCGKNHGTHSGGHVNFMTFV